ncbi:MAG: hypothetical protein PF549_01430 [Patescibacteria group bacterium]|nr:hypothetical protein [Patescibacteria group bacterium]
MELWRSGPVGRAFACPPLVGTFKWLNREVNVDIMVKEVGQLLALV